MSGISSTLQILNSLGGYSQSRPHKCDNALYHLICSENAQNIPTLKKVQRLNYFLLTAATMLLRLYAYGTKNAPQQCCIHVEMTRNNHHLCSKIVGEQLFGFKHTLTILSCFASQSILSIMKTGIQVLSRSCYGYSNSMKGTTCRQPQSLILHLSRYWHVYVEY